KWRSARKKIRGSGSQREATTQRGRRPATTSKCAVENPQQPKHNRRLICSQALSSFFNTFSRIIPLKFPKLPSFNPSPEDPSNPGRKKRPVGRTFHVARHMRVS